MTNILDVFSGDAFSMQTLSARVNEQPFVPGRAGALGIFSESGIPTTTVDVELQAGSLALIPTRERGAPPNQSAHGRRTMRTFKVPHMPIEDSVLAAEMQNVRAFGGTELQGIEQLLNQRFSAMKMKAEATIEYGRIGAIKGVIYDADGSTVIFNLFTEFGISQTSIDFVLGTAGTSVKSKCHQVVRTIEDQLGAMTYSQVHCFCGKEWFDKFVGHAEVKAAYERYQEGSFLRTTQRTGFEFAGITFEEYRGKVGGVAFVPDAEAYAFPRGVPELFITRFAPGDSFAAVNTPGLPMYAMQERMKYDKGVNILLETNPLSLNTRPGTSVKLTTSN